MKSRIAAHLKLRFQPVALLRTDIRPEQALQPREGKYCCVMSMFAQVAAHGKTAVFDRSTYGCPGAVAGLGMGTAYTTTMGGVDTFAAFFSKGLESAVDTESYLAIVEQAPTHSPKYLSKKQAQRLEFPRRFIER